MPLGVSRGPGSASGGLVAAKFVKCPKSYYTEQFEKYGYIRDKYDTTYNTPTPYDPSLVTPKTKHGKVHDAPDPGVWGPSAFCAARSQVLLHEALQGSQQVRSPE